MASERDRLYEKISLLENKLAKVQAERDRLMGIFVELVDPGGDQETWVATNEFAESLSLPRLEFRTQAEADAAVFLEIATLFERFNEVDGLLRDDDGAWSRYEDE